MSWVFILIPIGYVAVVTAPLVVVDVREHRLPNKWVMPGYIALAAGLVGYVIATLTTQSDARVWMYLLEVVVCSLGYFVFLLLLSLLGGMGMGDVKLAGLLGGAAAMLGVACAVTSVLIAFLLGGLVSLGVVVAQRLIRIRSATTTSSTGAHATRKIRIPFGPFMLAGFWVSVTTAAVTTLSVS